MYVFFPNSIYALTLNLIYLKKNDIILYVTLNYEFKHFILSILDFFWTKMTSILHHSCTLTLLR